MAHFDARKKCFVGATGTRFKGVTGAGGRNKVAYKGTRGLELGTKVDADFTSHINKGTPLQTPYATRLMGFLKSRALTPVEAQVAVGNASKRRATAVDILCTTATGDPFIVEVKTTTMPLHLHMCWLAKVDERAPKFQTLHSHTDVPNTMANRWTDQILCTMNLYARTKRLSSGTTLKGAVVAVCTDAIRYYPYSIEYIPNSGINYCASKARAGNAATPRAPKRRLNSTAKADNAEPVTRKKGRVFSGETHG